MEPGRVAVVTGGASGIGFALARRFLERGMRVAIADIESAALDAAVEKLESSDVIGHVTDVASAASVDGLRDRTLERFGRVDVVCNNAGVGGPNTLLWQTAREEWDWVLGVNFFGIVNGINAFAPLLVEQNSGWIVNTASVFGLFTGNMGPYSVSKHAAVVISENLSLQLQQLAPNTGVTVLCPGAVNTNIPDSIRNAPASVTSLKKAVDEDEDAYMEMMRGFVKTRGKDPLDVADLVLAAIQNGTFYLFTDAGENPGVMARVEAILSGAAPRNPMASRPLN